MIEDSYFINSTEVPSYKKSYSFSEDWFTHNIPTWQSKLKFWAGKDNVQALEIGTFEGRSAFWLLENVLTSVNSGLICIDPYLGSRLREASETFERNLEMSGLDQKVSLIKERSEIALPALHGRQFDIIYVDGHHEGSQVTSDGEDCWKLLKAGGIMIFDDYSIPEEHYVTQSPQEAIDMFLNNHAGEYSLVHKEYQVFILKN
jgi:predicted O-methyltransferase YrrM